MTQICSSGLHFERLLPRFRRIVQIWRGPGLGTSIAMARIGFLMSLVRLLGFSTLNCGCVSGRYREMGTSREITYIEEKGGGCGHSGHQRNQPVSPDRVAHGFATVGAGTARVS